MYESFSGHLAPESVRWISLMLVMFSPVSNGWVYGIKSKTIQMTFVHFARKQIYKSEVGWCYLWCYSAATSSANWIKSNSTIYRHRNIIRYIVRFNKEAQSPDLGDQVCRVWSAPLWTRIIWLAVSYSGDCRTWPRDTPSVRWPRGHLPPELDLVFGDTRQIWRGGLSSSLVISGWLLNDSTSTLN